MYVFQSIDFQEKAQNQRIADRIQRIISDLESVERVNSNNVPRFPGRYGSRYLKHEENAFRIVAELLAIEDVQVIYLHTIFVHDRNYEWFQGEMKAKRFPFEPDIKAVQEYIKVQKRRENTRIRVALATKTLPLAYAGWLKRPDWDNNDWVIYEGEEWINRSRRDEFKERMDTLCQIVAEIVSYAQNYGFSENPPRMMMDNNVQVSSLEDAKTLFQAYKNEKFILFSIHQVKVDLDESTRTNDEKQNGFSRKAIFLLAPFDHMISTDEAQEFIQEAYPFLIYEERTSLNFNDIARAASRVYPAYIPLDIDLWEDIEKEEGINLALSAEEEKILFSLSSAGPHEYRLPIFINGRAGSGKSTILFYLFTQYCLRLFNQQNENMLKELGLLGTPLFLTYNQELLKIARNRVSRMLKTQLMITDPKKLENLDLRLSPMLKPFRDFLRELLPDDEEYQFFNDDSKHITFHKFKQLFLNRLHNQDIKRYSADLCWYVIRTFIKGYALDGYLDAEQYDRIFQKDRILPTEDFEKIYQNVWKWYYEYCQEHDLWDDQDLIRAVLENEVKPHEEFTAIFCDEAQDFTKLELHFILQSSIFSQFDLGDYGYEASLPFAFAGDPLQTLNPTGFRWAKVQSIFYDEIINSVDPQKKLELRIKPLDDLVHNYRSTKPIVEITNTILLVRNYLFDQQEKPQTHWGRGHLSFVPQKFILDQVDMANLKRNIQDTIILVPCDEGGELDYIREDPQLSQLFPEASEENKPRNVISAIGAKGLEFSRVILYKFGEACPQKVWRGQLNSSERVEAEYFYNKFYVAATRATKWLFALESVVGNQKLWEYMEEQKLIQYTQRLRDSESWTVRPKSDENSASDFTVREIKEGTAEGLNEISEKEPELIAKEFKDKGIATGNPDYLRRAKNYYISLNELKEAERCDAYAMKIEGKYKEAGERFQKIKEVELAKECFWEGELWGLLLNLEGEIGLEVINLARFMVGKLDDSEIILNFNRFIAECIEKDRLGKSFNKQWKNVIAEYRRRINLLQTSNIQKEEWHEIGSLLEELAKSGFQDNQGVTGKCYFNAENLKRAIEIWEINGSTTTKEYYQAKARVKPYPANLEWWDKAGETDIIYQIWQDNGGLNKKTFDMREARFVGPILEDKQRYWDACQIYMRAAEPEVKKVSTLLSKIQTFTPKMLANKEEVIVLLNYLGARGQFSAGVTFLDKILKVLKDPKDQLELRAVVIRQLANAEITGDLIESKVVRQIYQTIIRPLRDQNWQKELSLETEFGPAVEVLGFDQSLRFYERLINDDFYPAHREYARRRWLNKAEQKMEYFKQKGEEIKDLKLLRDYSQRKRDWNLPESSKPPEGKMREITALFGPVKNLPNDIEIHEPFENQFQFKIGKLNFVVYKDKKIITLEDDDLNRVKIDLPNRQISSGELDLDQISGIEGKVFHIHNWKISGKIVDVEQHTEVEVALHDTSSPILITL